MRAPRSSLLFVLLWMAILLAPLGARMSHRLFGWPDITVDPRAASRENRKLAPYPKFRELPTREWGRATEAWYNDHLPARNSLIDAYKFLHFRVLKAPLNQQVPGVGDWVFRRGGSWPEMDDYVGAFAFTPEQLDDWRTLIEGRVAWAEAHGTRFLQVLTPVKAQIHPDLISPVLRPLHGATARSQLLAAMADSPALTNLLCLSDAIDAARESGREVFYHDDHHVNAYGCYLLYREIDQRLRDLWFPDLPPPPPFYDDPPSNVVARLETGCFKAYDRLEVSVPGSRREALPSLGIPVQTRHYPQVPIYVVQPGERRYVVFAHDSFLRYPLYSWHFHPPEHFAVPLGPGFDRIAMILHRRFNRPLLEKAVRDEIPDVLIEQFPESKLTLSPVDAGLDDTLRRAAAFYRAQPLPAGDAVAEPPSLAFLSCAVFTRVAASGPDPATASLLSASGEVLDTQPLPSGVRRAVFFAPVSAPPPYTLSLSGATADSSSLETRSATPPSP